MNAPVSFILLVPDTKNLLLPWAASGKYKAVFGAVADIKVLTIKWYTEYWFYICSSLYTYILDTESLDFIVSKRYQLSQGDDEVAPSIKGLVHIVRPVLLTFTLKDG